MAFQDTTYEQIRRARAKALRDELMGASRQAMGALGEYDDTQKAEAKLGRDLEDRKIKQERDAAEELRRVAEEGRAVSGEKRAADEAARAAARDAQAVANNAILRKKREADIAREDEAAKRVLREKTIEDTTEKARAKMGAGLSKSELEAMAKEAGITPEELDMRALESEEKRGVLRRKSSLDEKKAESEITKNEALAKKASRPAPGKSPRQIEEDDLRRRKLIAEVAQLEADRAGGGKQAIARNEAKKQQVLEVDNYVANIERNIDELKAMMDEVGTVEIFGPEQEIMDRKLTEIATDLAKLADPGSVAREGEVALQRKVLVPGGARGAVMRTDTAKQILDALRADVGKRRDTAYKIRGIDGAAAPASAVDPEFDALPDG